MSKPSRARRCKHWRKGEDCLNAAIVAEELQPYFEHECISGKCPFSLDKQSECRCYEPRPKRTPYAKGAAAERRWGKKLAALTGRIAQRTAGSKSPADLVLIADEGILLVVWEGSEQCFAPWGSDGVLRQEPRLRELEEALAWAGLNAEHVIVQCKATRAEALRAAKAWAAGKEEGDG